MNSVPSAISSIAWNWIFLPVFGFGLACGEANAQSSGEADLSPSNSITQTVVVPRSGQGKTADGLDHLITELVLEQMPHHYIDDDQWGMTSERWDGVKLRREGLKIETKRRKKTVNHGTWKKYSVRLLDPEEAFTITIVNAREVADGHVTLDVQCRSRLALTARQSKWLKGVQLYSLSIKGHATVCLTLSLEAEIASVPGSLPPDLVIRPKATAADLDIESFRIDRVSKLGGELAQQISKAARKQLDRKVAEKEKQLVEKINRQFDKKADRLRISFGDAFSQKWSAVNTWFETRDKPKAVNQAASSGN